MTGHVSELDCVLWQHVVGDINLLSKLMSNANTNTQMHKYINTNMCELDSVYGNMLWVISISHQNLCQTQIQIHKCTNTQIHKYTNTQMHKYTNAQIHKYTNANMCELDCVLWQPAGSDMNHFCHFDNIKMVKMVINS